MSRFLLFYPATKVLCDAHATRAFFSPPFPLQSLVLPPATASTTSSASRHGGRPGADGGRGGDLGGRDGAAGVVLVKGQARVRGRRDRRAGKDVQDYRPAGMPRMRGSPLVRCAPSLASESTGLSVSTDCTGPAYEGFSYVA